MKKKVIVTNQFEVNRYTRWLIAGISVEQLKQITQNQYSHNSLLAMRKDWLHFIEFCQNNSRQPLPTSPLSVMQFIEVTARERKYATLKRYIVTISNIHQMLGYTDPTANREVSLLLQQHRLNKFGDERPTTVFTRQHLIALRTRLANESDPVSVRNLALYSIMFECALKRNELRELNRLQIIHRENEAAIQIELQGNSYQLSSETSTDLIRWLALIQDNAPAVFRAIDKHGNISQAKLNDSSIFRIFQKASIVLGLPHHLSFSGQSARVGAVQELHDQGYKIAEIQQFGRWSSPVMPNHYLGNRSQAERGKIIFKSFKILN